jgi:hypothetical protein
VFIGICWDQWGTIAEIATAAAALIALGLGIPTWIRSRRNLKREIVNDLFKEYSSEDMGAAIHALHEAFRTSTGKKTNDDIGWEDKRKWIDHYKALYSAGDYTLHYQRRMVSSFYQRIAFSAKGRFVKRTVLEMWGQKDHPFVLNLLMPIETIAMPELLEGKLIENPIPQFNYKYPMWRMVQFWKKEQPIRWWRFRTNVLRRRWERKNHSS